MQLFLICHQLSKEYTALNPRSLEDWSFGDVIRLYADMRAVQIKEKQLSDPNYKRVIRRPATTWY